MKHFGDAVDMSHKGFEGDVSYVTYDGFQSIVKTLDNCIESYDLTFLITSTSFGADGVFSELKNHFDCSVTRVSLKEKFSLDSLSGLVICSWVEYSLHVMMDAMSLDKKTSSSFFNSCLVIPAGEGFCTESYLGLPFGIGASDDSSAGELNLYLSFISLISDFKKTQDEVCFISFCKKKLGDSWSPEFQSMASSLIHALDNVYSDMVEGVDYVFNGEKPVLINESTSSFVKEPSQLYAFILKLKHGLSDNLLQAASITLNISILPMLKLSSKVVFINHTGSLGDISNAKNSTYVDGMDIQSVNLNNVVKHLRATSSSHTYIVVDEKLKPSMANLPDDLVVISHAEFCDIYSVRNLDCNVVLMSVPSSVYLSDALSSIISNSDVQFYGNYARSSCALSGHSEQKLMSLIAKLNTQTSERKKSNILKNIFNVHNSSITLGFRDDVIIHNMGLKLILMANKLGMKNKERLDLFLTVANVIEEYSATSESDFLYCQLSNEKDTPSMKAKLELKKMAQLFI